MRFLRIPALSGIAEVGIRGCRVVPDQPTGTAYILLFPDGDNAIVLLGGANQAWGERREVRPRIFNSYSREFEKDFSPFQIFKFHPNFKFPPNFARPVLGCAEANFCM